MDYNIKKNQKQQRVGMPPARGAADRQVGNLAKGHNATMTNQFQKRRQTELLKNMSDGSARALNAGSGLGSIGPFNSTSRVSDLQSKLQFQATRYSPSPNDAANSQIQVQIQTKNKDQIDGFKTGKMKLQNQSQINFQDLKLNDLALRRASGPAAQPSYRQPVYSALRINPGFDERSASRMITSPSGHPIKASLVSLNQHNNLQSTKNAPLKIDANPNALRYHNLQNLKITNTSKAKKLPQLEHNGNLDQYKLFEPAFYGQSYGLNIRANDPHAPANGHEGAVQSKVLSTQAQQTSRQKFQMAQMIKNQTQTQNISAERNHLLWNTILAPSLSNQESRESFYSKNQSSKVPSQFQIVNVSDSPTKNQKRIRIEIQNKKMPKPSNESNISKTENAFKKDSTLQNLQQEKNANYSASQLMQQNQKLHQPKKAVNIDEQGHRRLREDYERIAKASQPQTGALGHQEIDDLRNEAAANEIIGFPDNLTSHALDHIDNELSNSLIMNAEELRQLQAQGMRGEKTEQELARGQITVDAADALYPFVKSCIHRMGWFIVDRRNQDEQMYDGSERLSEDLVWSDQDFTIEQFTQLKSYQQVNRFPGLDFLTKKDQLARQLNRMKKMFPKDFKIFPKTWVLPHNINQIKDYFLSCESNPYQLPCMIVKFLGEKLKQNESEPAYADGRGHGVFIANHFQQIKSLIDIPESQMDQYKQIQNPLFAIQNYVKNPYLIDGYKFDMRLYVLITNCNPLTLFLHREGYARFARRRYDPNDLDNLERHLTNIKGSSSNETLKSLDELFHIMKNHGVDVDKLWLRMKDIIIKTMLSLQPDLMHNYKLALPSDHEHQMCFQIVTFDMIIDDQCKPWLLKANQAPDFENGLQLENIVKMQVLTDTFKMLALNKNDKRRRIQQHKLDRSQAKSHVQTFLPSQKQLKTRYSKRLGTLLKNLGNYEWIFPIDRNQMVEKIKHHTQSENIKDTHYIQNESAKDGEKSETHTNYQLRAQTFQSSNLTMAQINSDKNLQQSKQQYSSGNLMQTIGQFPNRRDHTGFKSLVLDADHKVAGNLGPAITQVTIKRNSGKAAQQDEFLIQEREASQSNEMENEQEHDPIDEPYQNQLFVTAQTAQEAEKYYSVFQKTMNNILQKKKTLLLSPAQIQQRNRKETQKEKTSNLSQYAHPSKPMSPVSSQSYPKFHQIISKKQIDQRQQLQQTYYNMMQKDSLTNNRVTNSQNFSEHSDNDHLKLIRNPSIGFPLKDMSPTKAVGAKGVHEGMDMLQQVFNNQQFKQQLHDDQIQQLLTDAREKYQTNPVGRKTLQQQLMQIPDVKGQQRPKLEKNASALSPQFMKTKMVSPQASPYTQKQNVWIQRMQHQVSARKMKINSQNSPASPMQSQHQEFANVANSSKYHYQQALMTQQAISQWATDEQEEQIQLFRNVSIQNTNQDHSPEQSSHPDETLKTNDKIDGAKFDTNQRRSKQRDDCPESSQDRFEKANISKGSLNQDVSHLIVDSQQEQPQTVQYQSIKRHPNFGFTTNVGKKPSRKLVIDADLNQKSKNFNNFKLNNESNQIKTENLEYNETTRSQNSKQFLMPQQMNLKRKESFVSQENQLNLNDVSAESLIEASQHKDTLSEQKHIKSPVKHKFPNVPNMKKSENAINLPDTMQNQVAQSMGNTSDGISKYQNQDVKGQVQQAENLQHQLIGRALRETRSPTYLDGGDPHLFPLIGTSTQYQGAFNTVQYHQSPTKKSWFEHKYGYSKTQNKIDVNDLNGKRPSAYFMSSTIDQLLDTILSPGAVRSESKEDLHKVEVMNRNLSLLKMHAKSGASGQPLLRGSPSTVEMIKHEARSHSTIVASMKSLKLPQLTQRNYVPSSTLNDYKNSKIISHLELRQLDQFKHGVLSAEELSAHIRNMMGIKRVKAVHNSPSLPAQHRNLQNAMATKQDFISSIMNQQTGEIQSLSRLQRAIGFTGSYQLPIEEKSLPRIILPDDPVYQLPITFTLATANDHDVTLTDQMRKQSQTSLLQSAQPMPLDSRDMREPPRAAQTRMKDETFMNPTKFLNSGDMSRKTAYRDEEII